MSPDERRELAGRVGNGPKLILYAAPLDPNGVAGEAALTQARERPAGANFSPGRLLDENHALFPLIYSSQE